MEFSFRPSKRALGATLVVSAWFYMGGANANERQNEGESFPMTAFYGLTVDNLEDVFSGLGSVAEWGKDLFTGDNESGAIVMQPSSRELLVAGSIIRFSGED